MLQLDTELELTPSEQTLRGWSEAARSDDEAAGSVMACQGADRTSGAAAGLVNLSTTQTDPLNLASAIQLDPKVSRLKRMAFRVRQAAAMHMVERSGWPSAMFTFTVAPGSHVEPCDFRDCLQNFRNWASRKLGVKHLRYVWVAELQSQRAARGDLRGALHYHLLIWLPPELKRASVAKAAQLRARGARFVGVTDAVMLPKPDKLGWWKYGSTERDWVRKNAVAYITKYLTKGTEYPFPKGYRVHGAGGFNDAQKLHRSFTALPGWLRELTKPFDRCVRVIGGGWVSRDSGETFSSPWQATWTGTVLLLTRKLWTPINCESRRLAMA